MGAVDLEHRDPGAGRREQRLAELAELCRTHPDLRGRDTFPLPMVTMTVRDNS